MKISVIGTGYLGATHAACMASLGHDVLGVDINEDRAEALNSGRSFFHEPGLNDLLDAAIRAGRLRFTSDIGQAAQHAQVHFLTVGTPQQKGSYRADTSALETVVDRLVPLLSGENLLVGKSTVPVGTAHELQLRADDILHISGDHARVIVCWNPEFLREGRAVEDTLHPDRIVLGAPENDRTPEAVLRRVYEQILLGDTGHSAPPMLTMDLATSELVKVSANAFLATKISFINMVGEVCEAAGADVTVLARAIGLDERIGPSFLRAGLGFGGGCLPKDLRGFMARAGELGADEALTMLREVDAVNVRRREKMVALIRGSFGDSVLGHRITVLGAAFKPESDDVRDSPALSVAGALNLAGAQVTVHDPVAMENAKVRFPTLTYAPTLEESLEGAEAVVVATEWRQFRDLDPVDAKRRVARPCVFDGRNCLPVQKWVDAGWSYRGLGVQEKILSGGEPRT